MQEAQVTRQELLGAVHKSGFAELDAVRAAILENDGTISVIPKHQ